MKKLRKSLLSIFAFCLLIPCMFLFSACGEKDPEPYDVNGLTLTIKADVAVVYDKNATSEQKQEVEEGLPLYKADAESLLEDNYSIKFNKDGTAVISSTTYYYTQSKDLKTIKIYTTAEHTNLWNELTYVDGDYHLAVETIDGVVTIYYIFSK